MFTIIYLAHTKTNTKSIPTAATTTTAGSSNKTKPNEKLPLKVKRIGKFIELVICTTFACSLRERE